jgi:nucleoside-diphosphate-sugar epimerase
MCRKVIQAQLSGSNEIEIWGDGEQTRSFTYIDDCLEGTLRLMASDVVEPLNVGSDQLVTINQLVTIVENVAGVTLKRRYKLDAPKGRSRTQQRQHAGARTSRVGAVNQARDRDAPHLQLDPRADDGGHAAACIRLVATPATERHRCRPSRRHQR